MKSGAREGPGEESASLPQSLRPLAVAPATRADNGLTFFLPGTEKDLSAPAELLECVEAAIRCCNGYRTVGEAAAEVHRLTGAGHDTIAQALRLMLDHGLLIPATEYYQLAHQVSANPMPFLQDAAGLDIGRLQGTPHLFPSAAGQCSPLGQLLASRRSTRRFSGSGISADFAAGLCWAAYGATGPLDVDGAPTDWVRGTVSSAGGLYPLRLFMVLLRSPDLQSGLYSADEAGLRRVRGLADGEPWDSIFATPEAHDTAAGVLIITADFRQSTQKYSNRGYRYAVLEAGHVAQNAHLWCIERGMAAVEVGGFNDAGLARSMALEYPAQAPLTTLLVGEPDRA